MSTSSSSDDLSPTAPPDEELPPLRLEAIPGTAYDVLNTMHENVIVNFRNALTPNLVFPSLWRLAKHVVGERGIIVVYRYADNT